MTTINQIDITVSDFIDDEIEELPEQFESITGLSLSEAVIFESVIANLNAADYDNGPMADVYYRLEDGVLDLYIYDEDVAHVKDLLRSVIS